MIVFTHNIRIRTLKRIIFFGVLSLNIYSNNIENERRHQELEKRQHELENENFTKDKKDELEVPDIEEVEVKFYVEKINLIDLDNIFSKKETKKIISKYENKELTNNEVKQLIFDFTNRVIEKGYITTRIGIDEINGYKDNILTLRVYPGKIDEVILNDNNFFDKAKIFTSLPRNKNKVLRLQDIEQMVDRFNNINSNDLSVDIVAGRFDKTSSLILTNKQSKKLNMNLSYNNYGNESTGRDRGRLDLSYDNLLGINDNIYFIYQRGRNKRPDRDPNMFIRDMKNEKSNEDWYLNYSFPFREWSFDTSYSHSFTRNSVYAMYSLYDLTGKSTQINTTFNRIVYRNRYSKLNIIGGLKLKKNETYLEGIELTNRKLTIANIGLSHNRLFLNGLLGVDLTYDRGLPWFDAASDNSKTSIDPKAEFNRYNLTVNWYKPLRIKNKPFLYKFLFVGQYSDDVLYNSEKISLGDEYTVRGYKEDSLNGDKGYYIRNELSYDFNFKKKGTLTPYVGYDFGHIWNNHDDSQYKKGHMSGLAAGIKYNAKYFYLDATYSKPLTVSKYINKNSNEVYLKFGIRF